VGGFPMDKCAKVTINAAVSFLIEGKSVKEVHFVLFRKQDLDIFNSALEEISV